MIRYKYPYSILCSPMTNPPISHLAVVVGRWGQGGLFTVLLDWVAGVLVA